MNARQPLMADRFIRSTGAVAGVHLVDTKTVDLIKNKIRTSRKFLFDKEAIVKTGKVIREVPDLLFRESGFARAPYDTTWIEFSAIDLWKEVTQHEPDKNADLECAFLIDHDIVYTFSGGTKSDPNLSPCIMPFYYNLHTPWAESERMNFMRLMKCSSDQLDVFLWGSTYSKIPNESLKGFTKTALRDAHSCNILPENKKINLRNSDWSGFRHGAAGDLRNLIALLLMLNRPTITRYSNDIPASRGFLKGKSHQYFAHNVVTISVDPIKTIRLIGSTEGDAIARRRHEVRGTWCNDKTSREYKSIGCIHDWKANPDYFGKDDPNDPDHWVCSVCEGKRWWRSETTRGDSSIGYVKKEYSVIERTQQHRRNF